MGEAARLQKKYLDEVQAAMRTDFNYATVMQVPRLTKIVVNMGLGEAAREPKVVDSAVQELALITGRKPYVTLARKSIAGFKLREGMKIGAKVTLRGDVMWEFLDRLVSVALPRVRDFRGISPKGCDGRGNFSMGIREQIIFPEIDYDKIDKVKGLNITMVTTAKTDEECVGLLRHLGMPFRN
ncbi:MAG: 50S ribosomal protein L5 [Myxococcota bacterium]|nr:50S ribosomal protein L5 [Myxococcota bacterium]